MPVPRPAALGQVAQTSAAMLQSVYQRSRGRRYRERYLDNKRQDWQFRLGLAQSQLTEEYRQEFRYMKLLRDELDSLRDSRDGMRKLQGSLLTKVAGRDDIDLEFRGRAQNHSMMKYRRHETVKLEQELTPKTGTRSALEGIYSSITEISVTSKGVEATFEADIHNLLQGTATSEGAVPNLLHISEIETHGTISHRMTGDMLSKFISGEATRRGYALTPAQIQGWVEDAMGLTTGSLSGVGAELEVARVDGITAIHEESPEINWRAMRGEAAAANAELRAHADQAGALAGRLEQDILDLTAEIDIRPEPEAPDYEAVLEAATELYKEPRDLAGQMQLNKELGQLKSAQRALENLPPEQRAITEAFIDGAGRYRSKPGSRYTKDEQTTARAKEVLEMMRAGSLSHEDLYDIAKQWGRTRHEMEYETEYPGAAVSYDAKAQAGYTKDLLATVGAYIQEQEVAPLEEMTTMETGVPEGEGWDIYSMGRTGIIGARAKGTTMEVQEEGTEAIPTQVGEVDEDDPLYQALEEAGEGP